MATKVYITGTTVFIEQLGTSQLKMPQRISKYTILQPAASSDGVTVPEAENITFSNNYTNESRTEKIADVQNQAGATFADWPTLQKYLNFIPIKTSTTIFKEGASAENQLTMISQNTDIIEGLEEIELDARELKRIKEEVKTNNKILRKIYN